MGTGRKAETYNVAAPKQDRSNTRWYGDQSFSARNLGEDALAGVIFGCTNKTMNECLSKQLFGLPACHFSYVKNIKPGLPLFLFNYSDRKLYGIFEAATPGQLTIDQFAWSHDGRTKTQYPAQVRVSIKTQCLPLPENIYKGVISGNYHKPRHFHFELDHAQTRDLVSLFVPAPVRAIPNERNLSGPPAPVDDAAPNRCGLSGPLPSPTGSQLVRGVLSTESGSMDGEQFAGSAHSLDRNADHASASRTSKSNDEESSEWDDLDDGVTEKGTKSVNDGHPHINPVHGQHHDPMDVLQKLQELSLLQQDAPVKDSTSFEQRCGNDELLQIINELSTKTEAIGKKQIESDEEILALRATVKDMERKIQELQYQYGKLQLEYSAALLGEPHNILEGASIFLIGGHNGSTWLPSLDSFYPTTDRLEPLRPMSSARAYAAVAALNDHLFVFGGGDGSSWYNTVECYNRVSNEWITCPCLKQKKGSLAGATLNGKIFAIGGGDESRSFSEVEMFDPVLGSWIYSPSMQQCRFAPAAAELNGILYAVGGYDFNDNSYLQSAERYDPREGFWTQLASMKTKRGSHSVTVLGEALYALGGFDGDQMLSTVEIFDPRVNSWRIGSPFSVPRGYGCAVTADNNVYLIGGSKSNEETVETVEVYNERQGWSIPGYKAIGNRTFASAIIV